ncbi:Aspartic peptidase domain containing protein [Tylopilus felleus]
MIPSANTLLSLILITSTAVYASLVTRSTSKAALSFLTNPNGLGMRDIVDRDRTRAHAKKQLDQVGNHDTSFDIRNVIVGYTTQVGVGTPPTEYTLIVDTGSANIWIGANKSYVETSTSHDTGDAVSLRYGSGNFTGEEWTDTVTISPGLVIEQQSIGVANSSFGLNGLDGILGLGPVDLTNGTVSGVSTVPTVSNNLLSQEKISEEVLGVYFNPATNQNKSGELTFGGYDESAVISPVQYVPLTKTSPASRFWGFDQSISYGNETILPLTAGIVDTGSTFIMIASSAFQQYQNLTGGTLDSATGLLKITPDQYANLQPLTFNIGGVPFELSPNAQIWPRSLNTMFSGGVSGAIYLIVTNIGSLPGTGLDFIVGYTFLERFYCVLDATHGAVGFAKTQYTSSESN